MRSNSRPATAAGTLRPLLSRLRRVNLWPRLVLGVSLGFIALAVVLGLLILRVVQDSRERILQERLVIAQMAARQVDSALQRDFSRLEGVATPASLLDQDPLTLSEELASTLDNSGDTWLGLYLLDPRGREIAAAPAARLNTPLDPAVVPTVAEAVTANRREVSTPYADPVTGRPVAMLAVPVNGPDGPTTLVLGGVIDLSSSDFTGPLADATRLGETGHAELFDSRGLVIDSTDRVGFLAPGEHRQFYLGLATGGGESVETVPFEPRNAFEAEHESAQHIMARVRLSSAPWGIAVGGSEAETLAPVTDLRTNMLLLGAASLVVLWLAALIAARLLVRPVRVLTGAADRIAAGDLDTPIRLAEGGEIGRLGETLEAMRTRLKESLAEIEHRDRDLERRVDERTQEVQKLYQELQRREDLRGRLLESVITAQEDERRRIARELHDETGQALTGILMGLEAAREALDREPAAARERLDKASSLASQSIDAIRHLVAYMRPASLDDLGLVPALRAFAENRLREKGIRLKMDTSGLRDRLAPPIETSLFRVVQEAVTNIVRHSEAGSAHIELRRDNGVVSLLIEDDGRGFDTGEVLGSADPARALGLAGMEERVSLVGGRLSVDSAPGRGTRLRATIDLTPEAPQP